MSILRIRPLGSTDDTAWVALQDPASLQWDIADIEDSSASGTNQLGDSFCDVLAVKRTVACSWPPLNSSELATILDAISETYFELEYPDALTGAKRVMQARASAKSAPMYRDKGDGVWLWSNLSATFAER